MEVAAYAVCGAESKKEPVVSILALPPDSKPSDMSDGREPRKRNHVRSIKKIWNNRLLRPRKSTSSLGDAADHGPIIWNAASQASVMVDKEESLTSKVSVYAPNASSEYTTATVSVPRPSSCAPEAVRHKLRHAPSVIEQFAANPIRIIITPPEDAEPTDFDRFYGTGGNKSSLGFSSKRSLSETRSTILAGDYLDSNFLMPLTEHQINKIRERKANESREVRTWLVQLLNDSGDQFPPKLRRTLMHIYCINNYDLAPEAVARFSSEAIQDEGVFLSKEETEAESLRMLSACFQSQIRKYPSPPAQNEKDVSHRRYQSLGNVPTRRPDSASSPRSHPTLSSTKPQLAPQQYSRSSTTGYSKSIPVPGFPQSSLAKIPLGSNAPVSPMTILHTSRPSRSCKISSARGKGDSRSNRGSILPTLAGM